jgi:hypothetical protein
VAASAAADAAEEIVIIGRRIPKAEKEAKEVGTVADRMNKMGRDISSQIFGSGSPITKVMGRLGDFLEGTGYGMLGGGLAGMTGAKTSTVGSAIGGGIGQILGKDVLGPMLGKLGSFAGPLGAIAGGVIGGIVGGLFKKSKSGSATITNVDGDYAMSGNSAAAKGQAAGAADSVQGGINRIAEALGGSIGAFRVSIGTMDGKYRVDPSGGGATHTKKGAIDFGKDGEEAAIRYAILDALKDGAINGIREGSQRLLRAGKDLDQALEKALKFENVFRRLKAFKDPVGAAVDDINREFAGLIKVFQEAGASAQEYADLEELYGFERAQAIKNATSSTIEALNDFITGLTSGPDSPLSRRDVYSNARTDVDKFRADIAAGKAVDQDKLIAALENLQDASRELYGSRQPFFQDFDDILALATQARNNATSATGGANPTLPLSPFEAIRPALNDQLAQARAQTDLLAQIRNALLTGGGGSPGSTIDYLPGVGGGTGRIFDSQVRLV